jgi:hypothetical protein
MVYQAEVDMYDPFVDIVNERQQQIRQAALNSHRLAALRPAIPGVSQRLVYNLGGMLISFGTWLRERAPEPCDAPVPAASYSMPEGCS